MGGDTGEEKGICVSVPAELVEGLMEATMHLLKVWREDVNPQTDDMCLAASAVLAANLVAADILCEEMPTETLQ